MRKTVHLIRNIFGLILLGVWLQSCGSVSPTVDLPDGGIPVPTPVTSDQGVGVLLLPTSHPPPLLPEAIAMIDPMNGWGTREERVFHTTDGGSQWEDVTPDQMSDSNIQVSPYFFGADTAWVLTNVEGSDSGILYATSNGGRTWISRTAPFGNAQFQRLDSANAFALVGRGVAAGSTAVDLYTSIDDGLTWRLVHHVNPDQPDLHGIPFSGSKSGFTFLDDTTGWITGYVPINGATYLYVTHDGGVTWSPQLLPLPEIAQDAQISLERMIFYNAMLGMMPARLSTFENDNSQNYWLFFRTVDGGNTWVFTTPLKTEGVFSAPASGEIIVWSGTGLEKSSDGGNTWVLLAANGLDGASPTMMQFINPEIGWLISRQGDILQLYQTLDGGQNWSLLIKN